VGDAFTLVTPENASDVRDIERFIGQSVPELRLPGFDYRPFVRSSSPAPQRGGRSQQHGRGQPRGQGHSRGGPGGGYRRPAHGSQISAPAAENEAPSGNGKRDTAAGATAEAPRRFQLFRGRR
jgi:ATP-dependent RNA helicase RhlE